MAALLGMISSLPLVAADVEPEEVETRLETDDRVLSSLKASPRGASHSEPRLDLLGLLARVAERDKVSGRGESHPPALAEPDLNLSTHPAPIAQPSRPAPSRQCANSRETALRPRPEFHRPALAARSRLSYFRRAHRTRWSLSRRRE